MSKKTQEDKEQPQAVDAEQEVGPQGAEATVDAQPEPAQEGTKDTERLELEPQPHDDAGEETPVDEPEEPQPRRGHRFAWGLVVVLVAFLLGGGAVGYWGWQQVEVLRKSLVGDVDGLEARVAKAEAGNEATSKALAATLAEQADPKAIEALEAEVAALKSSQTSFQTALDDLAIAARASSKELVVSESQLLLTMANDRLRFERNVAAAIKGLEAAKSQLASLQSGTFSPVIAQIDTELEALESAPKSEIGGIAKQLGALAKQVGGLPLTQPDLSPDPQPSDAGGEDGTRWQALLDSVSSNLSQFIQVRRADGSDMPAVIPAEEDIVRQTLQLVLQNARLAAVRRDVENYQLSLQQALDMLAQYFDAGDPGVEDATEQVQTLLAKQIDPELPDVSGSLEMLNALSASGAVTQSLGSEAESAAGDDAHSPPTQTDVTQNAEMASGTGDSTDASELDTDATEQDSTLGGDTTQ